MKSKNILITGGLGFLGQHIIYAITGMYPGIKIKVLEQRKVDFFIEELNTTNGISIISDIDILNPDSMDDHFRGVDAVYHVAALVSFWTKDRDNLYNINVQGTENIISLCKKHNVKRMIYVSSTGARGSNNNKDVPIDETYNFSWKKARTLHYMHSKHIAEEKVRQSNTNIFTAVIGNPSSMFGPGNNQTVTNQINSLIEGKVPAVPPGGQSVTDVRDIALGFALLLEKGNAGENYLMIGGNYTYHTIVSTLAGSLNIDPPKKVFPMWIGSFIVPLVSIMEKIALNSPGLTKEMAVGGFQYRYYKSDKAAHELGWTAKYSLEETCRDTVDYYNNHTSRVNQ